MKLYRHQADELKATENLNRVAYYHDMGLGKTFTGAAKMMQLGQMINIIICQKSKVGDWVEHFKTYYPEVHTHNLTIKKELEYILHDCPYLLDEMTVLIINYELAFRRKDLLKFKEITLMLDESSLIQNEQAKRSKFIMKMHFKNLILLSGTPTSGKYENLWSQLHLLGWPISKRLYWKQYIDFHYDENNGFPIKIIDGYKNVDRLKAKMRQYGCRFLKTEDVFDLPDQVFQTVNIDINNHYRRFKHSSIVTVDDGTELVGDSTLTKILYERQLCGQYNTQKLIALKDLLKSTDDRMIIFYNFTAEMHKIAEICNELDRPVSFVNGQTKALNNYDQYDNSVTLIQYQAGAMGLNLQKANKIIYFTPPLSSELFEQSKKRTHRIGQNKTCFYYYLTCKNSIEEKIYKTLAMRKDYTDKLFEEDER